MEHNAKPSVEPLFTFDDLPPNKWRNKIHEFGAWIDLQMLLNPHVGLQIVLTQFSSRITSTLEIGLNL